MVAGGEEVCKIKGGAKGEKKRRLVGKGKDGKNFGRGSVFLKGNGLLDLEGGRALLKRGG